MRLIWLSVQVSKMCEFNFILTKALAENSMQTLFMLALVPGLLLGNLEEFQHCGMMPNCCTVQIPSDFIELNWIEITVTK